MFTAVIPEYKIRDFVFKNQYFLYFLIFILGTYITFVILKVKFTHVCFISVY